MNKRAALLIFSLLAMLVLSALATAFYLKSISGNQLVSRSITSSKAFWAAEAGVAAAINTLSGPATVTGSVGTPPCTYSAVITAVPSTVYYNITSTGSATYGPSTVNRVVTATVKTGIIDGTKFKYAIETTTDLVVKGSVNIDPSDSWKEYATLDFAAMFGVSKAVMQSRATHVYTDASFGAPVDGITWVNVAPGNTLTIAGNLAGSGILIVNGDVHFAGTVDFEGIIYAIGELTITGTVAAHGAVLAESSTTVDTELKGNVELLYDPAAIVDALTSVQFLTKEVVSWHEQ